MSTLLKNRHATIAEAKNDSQESTDRTMDILLPYFERELGTLRRLCKEFATKHPRLARLVKVPVDRATLGDGKVIEGTTTRRA